MVRKTKRLVLLLAVAGAALVFSSTIALAAVKVGTEGNDRLTGTDAADQINGKGGNDKTNGRGGDDVYYYADGFGVDTLKDSAGSDTLNFSRATTDLGVYLIPEWGASWNAAYNSGNKVNMGSSIVENAVGGSGSDSIQGGKDANTLIPGGGARDELIDWGGYDVVSQYPEFDAIPVSNDVYRGFSGNTGLDHVVDYGGSADKLDLSSFYSYEVYVDAVDLNNNGTDESLLLLTGDNVGVIVEGYFRNYYAGQEGKIEQIVFADGTFDSASEVQALTDASAQDSEQAAKAEELVSKEGSAQ